MNYNISSMRTRIMFVSPEPKTQEALNKYLRHNPVNE